MSPLIRTLVWNVAKRAAADPRVRRMAADAAARAKPRVEAAVREIRGIARDTSPIQDPVGFVRKARDQLLKKR